MENKVLYWIEDMVRQKSYSLPSALADGNGSQHLRVIANAVKQSVSPTQRVIAIPRNEGGSNLLIKGRLLRASQ